MQNTIASLLKEAKNSLREAHIPSFALDADLIMAQVLGATREHVICNPQKEISADKAQEFYSLIDRRQKREPLSHILQNREFWGMDFKVTDKTLDPRPDSECLIEAALELFDADASIKIIDFGTGTGCLLLTLLSEYSNAKGLGVDISEAALNIAKENSVKLNLAKRCDFVVNNWGREIKGKYDLIISNPPYIITDEIEGLEPEVSIYEPRNALDGGIDGLKCYKDLAPFIFSLLRVGGFTVIELGFNQDQDVKKIMENAGLEFIKFAQDLAGINRAIILTKNTN